MYKMLPYLSLRIAENFSWSEFDDPLVLPKSPNKSSCSSTIASIVNYCVIFNLDPSLADSLYNTILRVSLLDKAGLFEYV